MDPATARAVLGVAALDGWEEIRAAYRREIGRAHPDRAGGDGSRAAQLNVAYATLVRARRSGALDARPPGPAGPAAPSTPPAAAAGPPPEVLDGHTVHLAVPPDEAFVRLVEACHRIGDVTYVDRSCAILEALVRVEGEGVCSLVISFQGRAQGTDAFCTLEAIERVASPPVHDVVAALVAAL